MKVNSRGEEALFNGNRVGARVFLKTMKGQINICPSTELKMMSMFIL